MEITEVRIKLMEESGERLQAFCSITFDDSFVVRDLKIIEGSNGPFVAMPSRKLSSHCPNCGMKNHLRASYCNQCGLRLREQPPAKDEDGRTKLYADIAHPINSACREMIQNRVIEAFAVERERASQPGYVPQVYEEYDDEPVPEREAETASADPLPLSPAQLHAAERPRGPQKPAVPRVPASRGHGEDSFGAGIFE